MSSSSELELPVYAHMRCEGHDYTLMIDQDKNLRYAVRWMELDYLFPITFPTFDEAEEFAEGWLDMVEKGILVEVATRKESSIPSGKDLMGLFALLLLLGTLVLLLYIFG